MANRSRTWSISGLPATVINGFGTRSVNGRILVPNPAAKTMALAGREEDIGCGLPSYRTITYGTIEGAFREFSLLQCASKCGPDFRQPIAALKLARATKGSRQMLLIPEFELG